MTELDKNLLRIKKKVDEKERYAQLAEEAAELAQAALKARRAMDSENPTPEGLHCAFEDVVAEYSDVVLCAMAADVFCDKDIVHKKAKRWLERIRQSRMPTVGPYTDRDWLAGALETEEYVFKIGATESDGKQETINIKAVRRL